MPAVNSNKVLRTPLKEKITNKAYLITRGVGLLLLFKLLGSPQDIC
jgi:hypothetical protein